MIRTCDCTYCRTAPRVGATPMHAFRPFPKTPFPARYLEEAVRVKSLQRIVALLDARRGLRAEDSELYAWLTSQGLRLQARPRREHRRIQMGRSTHPGKFDRVHLGRSRLLLLLRRCALLDILAVVLLSLVM